MSRGRNYTAGERAVAVLGVLSGKSLMEINEQLRQDAERSGGTLRPLPEGSYALLKRRYAMELAFGKPASEWARAWEHITAPKTVGDL